jgi:S1-C subfamily serine protease
VLRIGRTGLTPARLGSSGHLRVGVMVVAIGNALALGASPTASLGIVSALDRSVTTANGTTYTGLIQTDAAINPGDSGGPLVNAAGQIVGINTAGVTSAENIGFAISIDVAKPVLTQLAHG